MSTCQRVHEKWIINQSCHYISNYQLVHCCNDLLEFGSYPCLISVNANYYYLLDIKYEINLCMCDLNSPTEQQIINIIGIHRQSLSLYVRRANLFLLAILRQNKCSNTTNPTYVDIFSIKISIWLKSDLYQIYEEPNKKRTQTN